MRTKTVVNYVNKDLRITGVPAEGVSAQMSLMYHQMELWLKLYEGKPCLGKPNKAVGSNAQVISNAKPVIINNEMTGAVVVFRYQ